RRWSGARTNACTTTKSAARPATRNEGEGPVLRLLLLSNSTEHGSGYLDHARDAIKALLAGVRELVFIPFALRAHDTYTARVRECFAAYGIAVKALPPNAAAEAVLEQAQAVFAGGGNTFRLLQTLQQTG